MNKPSLTPLEALKLCHQKDDQTFDDWNYVLDGPGMCPREMMAPFATKLSTGRSYVVSGDVGETIDETSTWISIKEF